MIKLLAYDSERYRDKPYDSSIIDHTTSIANNVSVLIETPIMKI